MLKEETGLELLSVLDVLKESYTAVGIGDEKVKTIIGIADGNFGKSSSADEEIIPGWFTKEEVKNILEKEYTSLRTQSVLYQWVHENDNKVTKSQISEYIQQMKKWIQSEEDDEWRNGYSDALQQVFVDLCKIAKGNNDISIFDDRFNATNP